MKATEFMATYRSIPQQVSTDAGLIAPQIASGKPQAGASPAVMKAPDSRERPAIELVIAYFAKRPAFCVNMCPNYAPLSDSCAVVDGAQPPERCPDLATLQAKESA